MFFHADGNVLLLRKSPFSYSRWQGVWSPTAEGDPGALSVPKTAARNGQPPSRLLGVLETIYPPYPSGAQRRILTYAFLCEWSASIEIPHPKSHWTGWFRIGTLPESELDSRFADWLGRTLNEDIVARATFLIGADGSVATTRIHFTGDAP